MAGFIYTSYCIRNSASFREDSTFNKFDKHILELSNKEPEGFSIKVINDVRNSPTLFIIGNDTRGMLFGVGYFLRKISMIPPTGTDVPKIFLRIGMNEELFQ